MKPETETKGPAMANPVLQGENSITPPNWKPPSLTNLNFKMGLDGPSKTAPHSNPKLNLTTINNTIVKMKPNKCQFITRGFLVYPIGSDEEPDE